MTGGGRRIPALLFACLLALAPAAHAQALPDEVARALGDAGVPQEALHALVEEVGAKAPRLQRQADVPVNPGSLFKLVTTQAALEMLGPAWTWTTPVWLAGPVDDRGVLHGSLVIQGSGDPTLVLERVWLLLTRVRQLGVREIAGDIVLDRSTFLPPRGTPADFDGEPLRPYNVQADALLLNHKAVLYSFVPDPGRGKATVIAEPPLAGVQVDRSVPLASGPCRDWRRALRATLEDPGRIAFAGAYPADCPENQWAVAHADPGDYNARFLQAMWQSLGGALRGTVRDGAAPLGVTPTFQWRSPPLAEVVRHINKFSNNVMAQQLFLTLALQWQGLGEPEGARALLRQWLSERIGEPDGVVVDNGSGLSRHTRLSVRQLARVLQAAWASPVMPELMSSLPLPGLDGTMRRSSAPPGRAHLKTGSLRDVAGIAGYVLGDSGRRYVLVAVIQHPAAAQARPALDALVQWTMQDAVRR